MDTFDVDYFVIGAGSGGVRSARIAAKHGAKVMVAESDRVGGTCVIRGCVPKKLMVLAGRFADDFQDARGFGWEVSGYRHDWAKMIAAKDKEIARLEGLYVDGLDSAGAKLVRRRAYLTGPNSVRLDDGQVVRARHILVATGGHPVKEDDVEGIELAVSSNEMFHLAKLPRRLAVIGGGYIAVEFAGLMRALGSDVTIVFRRDHLLRGFDVDIRTALESAYQRRGILLRRKSRIRRIKKVAGGLEVMFDNGDVGEYDVVLAATGRAPSIGGLGLETAGVKTEKGAVVVDDYGATNVPSVHAVGDVTDRVNLTPVAIREGHALADTLFGGKPTRVRRELVPTAVFSTPELGHLGLTEAHAHERGIDVTIYQTSFRAIKATLSGREDRMLMKLVVSRSDERVLGVHILGEGAAEMIQLAGVALTCGATKEQFDETIAVHPTAAEELVTMRVPTR